MKTEEGIGLRDMTDMAYDMVQNFLTPKLKDASISEGTAKWIPCPTTLQARGMYEGSDVVLDMKMAYESGVQPMALTFMCGRAMIYALYTACVDKLKRMNTDTHKRVYPVGTHVSSEIVVGDVHITLHMSIDSVSVA